MNDTIYSPRLGSALALLGAITFALSPLLTPNYGGFKPKQFPNHQHNPPVQPEGFFFSIWSVIYAWLILSGIYSFFYRADSPDWARSRWPLAISLLVGTSWLYVAKRSPVWATVVIVIMLATALKAMYSAGTSDPWVQVLPIGLYAGWLTAATGLSFAMLAAGYNYISNTTAAILALIGIVVAALIVQNERPDAPTYTAALLWAVIGIAVHNLIHMNPLVLAASLVGVAVLGLRMIQLLAAAHADHVTHGSTTEDHDKLLDAHTV